MICAVWERVRGVLKGERVNPVLILAGGRGTPVLGPDYGTPLTWKGLGTRDLAGFALARLFHFTRKITEF